LKKWLAGQRFISNEEVITETNAYFEQFPKSYHTDGIKNTGKKWLAISVTGALL
jgi:hypothetical protein